MSAFLRHLEDMAYLDIQLPYGNIGEDRAMLILLDNGLLLQVTDMTIVESDTHTTIWHYNEEMKMETSPFRFSKGMDKLGKSFKDFQYGWMNIDPFMRSEVAYTKSTDLEHRAEAITDLENRAEAMFISLTRDEKKSELIGDVRISKKLNNYELVICDEVIWEEIEGHPTIQPWMKPPTE